MKKILAMLMAVVCVFSMFAVSASALTKSDLLAEAAKSPVYKYVKVSVENAARTVEITEEQANQIMPIVKELVAILNVDKGEPGVHNIKEDKMYYTQAEVDAVMDCINRIAAILGYTAKIETIGYKNSILRVYDQNGKLVFEYDGDAVADTAAATTVNTEMVAFGAVALLVAGAAALVVSKKRVASVAA